MDVALQNLLGALNSAAKKPAKKPSKGKIAVWGAFKDAEFKQLKVKLISIREEMTMNLLLCLWLVSLTSSILLLVWLLQG